MNLEVHENNSRYVCVIFCIYVNFGDIDTLSGNIPPAFLLWWNVFVSGSLEMIGQGSVGGQ
jgi:hypothetical protein